MYWWKPDWAVENSWWHIQFSAEKFWLAQTRYFWVKLMLSWKSCTCSITTLVYLLLHIVLCTRMTSKIWILVLYDVDWYHRMELQSPSEQLLNVETIGPKLPWIVKCTATHLKLLRLYSWRLLWNTHKSLHISSYICDVLNFLTAPLLFYSA